MPLRFFTENIRQTALFVTREESVIYKSTQKGLGGDETRYSITSKRTLQDKNFGVFCKTIVSRCILCTRCVRLLVGTALFNFIGVAGRGIVAEISMFFRNVNFNDLLVGNIIDGPVGFLPKISVRLPYL
jgi:NADH dehydrogenase/NADH:ubiquinone oxidoreductase subunit G